MMQGSTAHLCGWLPWLAPVVPIGDGDLPRDTAWMAC